MTDHKKTFEESSIVSLLIKLSIPATIGMVFNALYNLVDTIFVGWAVGVKGIAGLTIALPIQMIIVALGLTFGSGAASIISRRLGENRPESAARASMGAFGLSLIFSVIIMVLGEAFMDPLLRLFGASPAILPYSRGYLRIILMGTWFRSFSIVGNQVSRAEGQPRVSMISQIIGAGLNMILDPLFIFVLKMGVAGAAWATIISQFFSFLYILRFLLSGRSHLPLKIRYLKADGSLTGEILSLGMPKFIRQAGMSLMVIVMNNVLGLYGGDLGIASYGLIHRLFLFTTMPIFGVVQGYQPIAGYCYGARQKERLGEVNRVAMITASIMSLGAFLLLEVPGGPFHLCFHEGPGPDCHGGTGSQDSQPLFRSPGASVCGGHLFSEHREGIFPPLYSASPGSFSF